MATVRQRADGVSGAGEGLTFTFPLTPKAGALLLLSAYMDNDNYVTPPEGWTLVKSQSVSDFTDVLFARVAVEGESKSVTLPAGTVGRQGEFLELEAGAPWSSVASAIPAVTSNGNETAAANAPIGSVVLPSAGYIFASVSQRGSINTEKQTVNAALALRCLRNRHQTADRQSAEAGEYSATFDWTGGTNRAWNGIVVAVVNPAATKSGLATVTGGGSATATGQKLALSAVSASGGGSVVETGQKVGQDTATASGGGSVALSGSKLAQSAASVSGGGSSSATGAAKEEAEGAEGTAAVSGGGSVTVSGAKRAAGTGMTSGGGGAAATANKTARAAVSVAGGGQVAGTGTAGRAGGVAVTGGGLIVSVGTAIRLGEVVVSGGGMVSALGKRAQSGVLGHTYGDPALRGEAIGVLRREDTGEVLGASRGALRGPVRSIP